MDLIFFDSSMLPADVGHCHESTQLSIDSTLEYTRQMQALRSPIRSTEPARCTGYLFSNSFYFNCRKTHCT